MRQFYKNSTTALLDAREHSEKRLNSGKDGCAF
jgi:hypothetical protein